MYPIRILIMIILAGLACNQLRAQKMVAKSFRFQSDSTRSGKLQQITQLQHAGTRLGKGSYLLLKGIDGAEQKLDSAALANWNYSSAYFNGNSVEISLYTAPGDMPMVNVKELKVNEPVQMLNAPAQSRFGKIINDPATAAIESSNFILNNYPHAIAVGRLTNGNKANGTGWIAPNGAIVTAWENFVGFIQNGYDIIEFNVPPSDFEGNHVHPAPEDQFMLDLATIREYHEDIYVRKYYWSVWSSHTFRYYPGYAILKVSPNSSGKTPGQKYQEFFQIARNPSSNTIDAMGNIMVDLLHYSETFDYSLQQKKALQVSFGQLLKASDYIKADLSPVTSAVPHRDNFILHNVQIGSSNNNLGERGAPITYQDSKVAIGIHTQGASNVPSIGYGFRAENLLNDLHDFFTPTAVYVDEESYNTEPNGRINQPYLTIPHLASDAPDHAVAYIARGDYALPVTIDRPMTLLAPVGVVRIGAGGGAGARMKNQIQVQDDIYAEQLTTEFIELEEPAAEGVYPNPFRDRTSFRFELRKTTPVIVSVFDLNGSKIAELLNTDLEPGAHSIDWDGNLPNGLPAPAAMYLLRFQQG